MLPTYARGFHAAGQRWHPQPQTQHADAPVADPPKGQLAELREQLATLGTEIRTLSEATELSEEQETRFAAALEEYTPLKERYDVAEARHRQVEDVKRNASRFESGADAPGQINRDNPLRGDVRDASRSEVRSRALAVVEAHPRLNARQKEHLEKTIGRRGANLDGDLIARNLLITETDEYHSAFMKGIMGNNAWTPEEARALNEYRALNEGTSTQGGFAVPVVIDPTIILTSGAEDAPILRISTIKTITTNQWKGVSSAGFDFAYGAEASVVPDNTPALAQPTIPVYRSQAFLPFTVEVEQDWPGFADEMDMLLQQGYVNLMAKKTMTGTGTNEPFGIFTRMQNTTTGPAHVILTTAGTIGAVDLRAVWAALPERFRPKAKWVMNVTAENVIRALGNNLALSDYTINMTAEGEQNLMAREVVDSDYAPNWTGTTAAASALVIGDFRNFYIIQRAGMVVEPVQHLFDPTTGRPIGERAWFAWARAGHDAVAYNAFRLLSNT